MQNHAATGISTVNGHLLVWAAVLVAGLALALTAQFVLDGWADQSDTAHQVQHGMLFWAGLCTGAAVLRLYQLGKQSA